MRKTQAIIDLSALNSNVRLARQAATDSHLMCVIKADAYGHGAVPVAKALAAECDAFAVAYIDEAIELRDAGVTLPIMILEGVADLEELTLAAKYNFWLIVHMPEHVEMIESASNINLSHVFAKVDTGMHRLGLMPSQADDSIKRLKECRHVEKLSIATHFSCADDLNNPSTLQQVQQITELAARHNLDISMANSAGILGWPTSRAQWNRAGIMLYGCDPYDQSHPKPEGLRPVMKLQAPIIGLRDIPVGDSVGYGGNWTAARPTKVATLAIGYADGYPRAIKAGTKVYLRGEYVPIIGNVSMDMITIDVTDVNGVNLGDIVEMWGDHVSVDDVASACNTIGYELLVNVTKRVTRKYSD